MCGLDVDEAILGLLLFPWVAIGVVFEGQLLELLLHLDDIGRGGQFEIRIVVAVVVQLYYHVDGVAMLGKGTEKACMPLGSVDRWYRICRRTRCSERCNEER